MNIPFQREFLPVWIGFCITAATALSAAPAVVPQPRAHAHNDYLHGRPLLDAMDQGFCSVEADIHLVDGQLRVAHDLDKATPGRTIQSLYLDPLRQRVRLHEGRVHPKGPLEFTLLVDIKSEAAPTYLALHKVLVEYQEMLTRFAEDDTKPGAVTVIISGNRPFEVMRGQGVRFAAMDGRLPDLEKRSSPSFMPLVSDHWGRQFQWNGTGPFPDTERMTLERWVKQAHEQGRRLRFWAVPDNPKAWRVLHDAGVDMINTDDLTGLGEFLRGLSNVR